jgi:hypothetical protein
MLFFYRDLARAIAMYPRPRKLSQWIPRVSRWDREGFCILQMRLRKCRELEQATMMSRLQSRRAIATIPRDHEQRPRRLPQGAQRDRKKTSDLRMQSRYTSLNRKSPRMRPRTSQKATALIARSDCDESPANHENDRIFEGTSLVIWEWGILFGWHFLMQPLKSSCCLGRVCDG